MAVKREGNWIDDIVGAICDPIIVYPGKGWERDLPPDLKKRVPLDRLIHNMLCLKGKASREECCDLEALLYLFPTVMAAPMPDRWNRIYLYLGAKVMGQAAPEGFAEEYGNLNQYDMDELQKLKRWVQQKKIEARKARANGEKLEAGHPAGQQAPQEEAIAYKLL